MIAAYLMRYQEALELPRAVFHWLRLGYYSTALRHVGHNHPDATLLTMRCLESQQVVEQFLEGRKP